MWCVFFVMCVYVNCEMSACFCIVYVWVCAVCGVRVEDV